MQAGPPAGSEKAFSQFRNVLTSAFELEVSVLALRTSARLLACEPDPQFLQRLALEEGAWTFLNYERFFQTLGTTLERAIALSKQATRQLPLLNPSQQAATLTGLLAPLEEMRAKIGPQRNAATHLGSLQIIPARGFWEGMATVEGWPELQVLMNPQAERRPRYAESAAGGAMLALASVGRMITGLDAAIAWQSL